VDDGSRDDALVPAGLLRIEECLDADGDIVLPPGVNLLSLIDRNIANVGDSIAYRYLDYTGSADVRSVELTWSRLGSRLRAIAARLQQVAATGERVAILAPQGLEYVAAFFASIKAGNIAVPLFAPELPGHAERLDIALRDAEPAVVLTTTAAAAAVAAYLEKLPPPRKPQVIAVDEIPDSEGVGFVQIPVDVDDVSHLQYTSGSTRPPVGVEITHRAVGTNLIQMILSIDLLDRNTHGVSWLPLYHDMGLSMIGFPAVYGGHSTLMSPTAFVRRPLRWIQALAAESRSAHVVTAAPNFAYEWTAQRGVPAAGEDIDLSQVVLIIGSEPVSVDAIRTFEDAFAPFGLPRTAIKPSYGIAEATLFVSTVAPSAEPTVVYVDRKRLEQGRAVRVGPQEAAAVAQVSCGQVARSQQAVIVDTATGSELPDGGVGEIWLHGNNIGRGYWNRPVETVENFAAELRTPLPVGSHAAGAPAEAGWLRTGDLGTYLDGELYVTGRLADLVTIEGRQHYPQHIEATVADASPLVRRGYVAAFSVADDEVPDSGDAPDSDTEAEHLVIIAERAARTARFDVGSALAAIRAAVRRQHGLPVFDVRVVPAGAIPRTTSGKLARRACRAEYLNGGFDGASADD
jgi:fatty-acyl-CoA synthase